MNLHYKHYRAWKGMGKYGKNVSNDVRNDVKKDVKKM